MRGGASRASGRDRGTVRSRVSWLPSSIVARPADARDFRIDRRRPVRYSLMRMSLNQIEADTRKPAAGRAGSCPDPEVERFRRYFQDGGLPFTEQRRRILEEVCRSASHFDAEELYGRIRRRRVPASRATLYRTLGHLERAGVLRRIDIGGDHAHFEFVGTDHHEHLVCTRCGRVVEIRRAGPRGPGGRAAFGARLFDGPARDAGVRRVRGMPKGGACRTLRSGRRFRWAGGRRRTGRWPGDDRRPAQHRQEHRVEPARPAGTTWWPTTR